MYTYRKPRRLNPDSVEEMDAFNEEFTKACESLGIPRETMNVTFEQGAAYLGLSVRTVQRYAYAVPPVLDLVHDLVDVGFVRPRKRAMVSLDSIIEYKLYKQFASRRMAGK